MTLLEVIQRSTEFLQKKGVESPRLQSELLLAYRLGVKRMRLYLDFERTLTDQELESIRELVKRRGQREPLQQIVGSTSFCGLELSVNRHVLVPRPETELLAEFAWSFLVERAGRVPGDQDAIDIGTGSGCIAIAIAAKCPKSRVMGVDVSLEALAIARQNAARHGLADRTSFLLSDRFSAVPDGRLFALIVSNPPYIPTSELETLQPEVRDFEPRLALDGGEDGLRQYRQLAAEAPGRLLPDGRMMVEFGDGQEQAVANLFKEQNWVVEKIAEDYTRRPRILIAKLNAEEHPGALS